MNGGVPPVLTVVSFRESCFVAVHSVSFFVVTVVSSRECVSSMRVEKCVFATGFRSVACRATLVVCSNLQFLKRHTASIVKPQPWLFFLALAKCVDG